MALYVCPHCGENVGTEPDPGDGTAQEYIEDCPVCCRPNRIVATFRDDDESYAIEAFGEI